MFHAHNDIKSTINKNRFKEQAVASPCPDILTSFCFLRAYRDLFDCLRVAKDLRVPYYLSFHRFISFRLSLEAIFPIMTSSTVSFLRMPLLCAVIIACNFHPIFTFTIDPIHATTPRSQQTRLGMFSRRPPEGQPAISTLTSRIDLIDFVSSRNDLGTDYINGIDDRVSVVLFHASWCRSCKKFQQLYKRLAASNADLIDPRTGVTQKVGSIRLAEMEYGANKAVCQSLGIKKLPTVFFYRKGEKVDGFSCSPANFATVLGTLQTLQDEVELERNLQAGDDLIGQTGLFQEQGDEQNTIPTWES